MSLSSMGWSRAGGPAIKSKPIEPIWFEWLMLIGIFAFAGWLLGARGVWALLITSDPTGITVIIILVFLGSTLWCGARAAELSKQRDALDRLSPATTGHSGQKHGDNAQNESEFWGPSYWQGLHKTGGAADVPLDLLIAKTHGPHATAWWVNAIQLKLGLLGKVIGFSILALNIGQLQNFDPAQSQELLKSLTTGLGVALLTTMVGLVGNILLGLQLTRLDRYADEIVVRAQAKGLVSMGAQA